MLNVLLRVDWTLHSKNTVDVRMQWGADMEIRVWDSSGCGSGKECRGHGV